eukprot:s1314_g2.t1
MTPTDLVCGMVTRGCKEGLQKYAKGSNTQAQAEQPENDPPGELEDDPVPRKDEETAAECIRLQNILDRMKQLMREERAVWNEERAQLLDELSATRRALSASEAAREAAELALAQRSSSVSRGEPCPPCPSSASPSLHPSFQPQSQSFGSLRGLGPEAELAVLKDGVRAALDAMSLDKRPSGPSQEEFRAYSRHLRPAGQWTRMQLEDDANRFKTASLSTRSNRRTPTAKLLQINSHSRGCVSV